MQPTEPGAAPAPDTHPGPLPNEVIAALIPRNDQRILRRAESVERVALWVPRTVPPGLTSNSPQAGPHRHHSVHPSMIARHGPRSRLSDVRSRAELAGTAGPLQHRQG